MCEEKVTLYNVGTDTNEPIQNLSLPSVAVTTAPPAVAVAATVVGTRHSSSDDNDEENNSGINGKCVPTLRFPQKLWHIVNESNSKSICWGPSGETILLNYEDFHQEFLLKPNLVFKTTNITSFVRQLNLYGFRKVNSHNRHDLSKNFNREINPLDAVNKPYCIHEFLHEFFRAGRPELLSRVCRKTKTKAKKKLQPKTGRSQIIVGQKTISSSKLKACRMALKKALNQAKKQYWIQKLKQSRISNECNAERVLRPQQTNIACDIATQSVETSTDQEIEIILQDLIELENTPCQKISEIDLLSSNNSLQCNEEIQWEEILNLTTQNAITLSVLQ
ncbi:flocculation suppression protein-like [Trichogramma pretiosum]|uniref:flocculation suppression protein-like n=1 Tax=Trichogramma pretiosum TaxID=7493 RepID=UPI0006C941F2|nr:flocculation suppression protein-like [Trichogramma pretiosum]